MIFVMESVVLCILFTLMVFTMATIFTYFFFTGFFYQMMGRAGPIQKS